MSTPRDYEGSIEFQQWWKEFFDFDETGRAPIIAAHAFDAGQGELDRAKYHLAWELVMAIETVRVEGDPSWVGWAASVEMKGLILTAVINAMREKGIEVPRR